MWYFTFIFIFICVYIYRIADITGRIGQDITGEILGETIGWSLIPALFYWFLLHTILWLLSFNSWLIWLLAVGLIIFLILCFLDWLDEDEFIAEQKRIEKEEDI